MHADVEALLDRQARAGLPISRQLLLYLDPFALFKDASRGSAWQQELALQYNRAMRWILLPYIRRWITIAAALFLCIAPAEALAAKQAAFIYPAAALAVGCCIAVTVTFCTLAAYLLLSSPPRR
jgi:hypothetical protein